VEILFDQATVGLIECDLDGRLLRVNGYFCDMVGRSRDDLIGSHLRDVVHPDDLPHCESLLAGMVKEHRYEVEKRFLRSDGTVVWARTAASLVHDGMKSPQRAVAVCVNITEDRRRAEELRQSEERFRQLANSVPGFIWTADPDGRATFVNEPWTAYTGLSGDEAAGFGWASVFHPDELEAAHEMWRRAQETRGPYQSEFRLRGQDGTYRWFDIQANPVFDAETGRIVSWSGTATDIHARKVAESALRESEERFRMLARSLPGFVWSADTEGNVSYINEGWSEYTGLPISEGLGFGWLSTVHPDDVAPTMKIWGNVRLLGMPYDTEFRYRRHDGVYRWHLVRARPCRDPVSGELTTWFGTSTDIHEHKMAETALQESEQRLRATYEHAAIGIGELDAEGRFIQVNEWLCALMGYERDELLRRRCHDIVHPDDRPADLEQFHRLMAGEFETYSLEQRFINKSGEILWASVSASRVDDELGNPLYGIRVVRDISARKRAEETRTLLIHELNHRVKNTLSTVQSIISQSLRKAGAPPDAREDIESRLFALSRAHDVLTREGWEGAWLTEVVSEAIAPYRRDGAERFRISGPDIRLNTAQALAMAMAFQELATNAVKYGSLSVETGVVAITWSAVPSAHGRRLRLSWKESGGPPVEPPLRRGFGTRLIERGLASELAGDVRIDFAPDGVECVADVPLK